MAIEKTVDEVKIARSAAAGADRELAGQVRFGARGEGRHFLVAHVNPLDFRLPANGVREAVEAVANDSVYSLNPRCRENLRKLICNCLDHCLSFHLPGRALTSR